MTSGRRVQVRAFGTLLLVILLAGPAFAQAPTYPGATWTRTSSPEQLGWSSEKLKEAKAYATTINTAALMVVVNGTVLDEWGETAKRFNVHSIRKSFLSALYGIQVREGRIHLSTTLADLGLDDRGSLTGAEKGATVADLLKARSGIYHPALYETPEMAAARPA
jgi:CubicO group peptidase (beta-lactamase class C family)